jgi:hypothetical protein
MPMAPIFSLWQQIIVEIFKSTVPNGIDCLPLLCRWRRCSRCSWWFRFRCRVGRQGGSPAPLYRYHGWWRAAVGAGRLNTHPRAYFCNPYTYSHCKDKIPKIRNKNIPRKGKRTQFFYSSFLSLQCNKNPIYVFSEKELGRSLFQFPHSCVCEWCKYSAILVCLFCWWKICRPILVICKSFKDTWKCECGNWDWGRPDSFSGNT